MTTVHIEGCLFFGKNLDGTDVFEYEIGDDGLERIKSIRMIGWNCTGPLEDGHINVQISEDL